MGSWRRCFELADLTRLGAPLPASTHHCLSPTRTPSTSCVIEDHPTPSSSIHEIVPHRHRPPVADGNINETPSFSLPNPCHQESDMSAARSDSHTSRRLRYPGTPDFHTKVTSSRFNITISDPSRIGRRLQGQGHTSSRPHHRNDVSWFCDYAAGRQIDAKMVPFLSQPSCQRGRSDKQGKSSSSVSSFATSSVHRVFELW